MEKVIFYHTPRYLIGITNDFTCCCNCNWWFMIINVGYWICYPFNPFINKTIYPGQIWVDLCINSRIIRSAAAPSIRNHTNQVMLATFKGQEISKSIFHDVTYPKMSVIPCLSMGSKWFWTGQIIFVEYQLFWTGQICFGWIKIISDRSIL